MRAKTKNILLAVSVLVGMVLIIVLVGIFSSWFLERNCIEGARNAGYPGPVSLEVIEWCKEVF